jgi:predicted metal-binding membrane protein
MIGALRTPRDRRWYQLALGALVLAAWSALVLWGASPYAGLLDHRGIEARPLSPIVALAVFTLGWTLMTIAMMLPSSLPLVNLFRRFVEDRPHRSRLLLLLGTGYLGVWACFGVLAYLGDSVLHGVLAARWGLVGDVPAITAAILLGAGVYQFTPLKQMCLTQCRSPYSFLVQHWRGRNAELGALRLGMRHGLFCVGCCWTLMLLMFAVGGVNLGWMLGLGAVMAAERTTRWGRRLTRPLGVALILGALLCLVGAGPYPTA